MGIGHHSNKYLRIKNTTPMVSEVSLEIKQFDQNTIEKEKNLTYCPSPLLNKSDSRTGINISIDKQTFIINPFESVIICITAKSTMWGTYKDTLEIKAGYYLMKIPIRIDVAGMPVKIYSGTITENHQDMSIIRYLFSDD